MDDKDPNFEISKQVELVLAVLPLLFTAFAILYDFVKTFVKRSPSNAISRLIIRLYRPFTDFLQWSDLAEFDPLHPIKIQVSQWKRWVSVTCGCLATGIWTSQAIIAIIYDSRKHRPGLTQATYYAGLMAAAWLYMSLRLAVRPISSAPIGNLLFYGVQVFYCLTSSLVHVVFVAFLPLLIISGIPLLVLGTLPMTAILPSDSVSSPTAVPTISISSPEDSVSFWTWFTFSFPSLYYPTSSQRRLNAEDIWKLSPWFLHRNLFTKYLNVQSSFARRQKKQSLIMFLLGANSRDIILDITIEMYKAVSGFIPPYALKQLLAVLASEQSPEKGAVNKAHYWALVTFVAHLSFAQCDLAQGWFTRRCYERTRGVIFCTLHWKALKRRVVGGASAPKESKSEEDKTSEDKKNEHEKEQSADLGKVVNLMQGDAYNVAQRFWEMSPIFALPVRIGIALWFLYDLLGPSAFAGVAVILLAYLINWPLIKWNLYITRNSWKARDKRMKSVNELFQSIRFLKMVGWESEWCKRVLESREVELAWRVQSNICSAILVFIWTWIPSATALASFIAYTLVAKRPLTVSVAFTALGVFDQLQGSMTALPGHIFALFYAYISMQRINTFLSEDEVPDWASALKATSNGAHPNGNTEANGSTPHEEKIGFENATIEWHHPEGKSTDASATKGQTVPSIKVTTATPLTALGTLPVEDANAAEEQLVSDEDRHPRLDQGQPLNASENGTPEPVHIINVETAREVALHGGNPSISKPQESRPFKFDHVTVSIPPGRLTLVIGNTGAGKTAFLMGLLGEMNVLGGKVHLDKSHHRVAYCAQTPWLEHATIRDNIVYGSPLGFDEAKYDQVVHACALEKDLEILPAGDMTEIGEKGVSLSGGQRARIALARALYSPARTILLDDPLAAVDMHTARYIVQYCLGGPLMKDRTVILVTHHVRLCLKLAEFLVEIDNGKISRSGHVEDLGKGTLKKILETNQNEEEEDAEKDVVEYRIEDEVDALLGGKNDSMITKDKPADESGTETPKWRMSTAEAGKLVDEEARAEGRVSWRTYKTYIRAAGYWTWALTFALMILMRAISILNQLYLSKWGEAYNKEVTIRLSPRHAGLILQQFAPQMSGYVDSVYSNQSFTSTTYTPVFDDLPPPSENVKPWLWIYFLIATFSAFTVMSFITLGFYASLIASRSLFTQMIIRLTHAPTRFFDITPVGRILNRFVADIGAADNAVNNSLRGAISGALSFVASFCVIVYVVPAFAPIALFIAWLYIRLAPSYVRTSRDLRRLESVALSPAFAGFDELLHGLVHVRAFGVEQRYQDRFYKRVDTFQAFDHSYWLVSFWLRWRYDCLGTTGNMVV